MSEPVTAAADVAAGGENNEATQVDPFEVKAKELGWRPQAEYDGDADEWVDAKEFVKRAPLFERIKSTNKRLRDQEKIINELKTHIHTVGDAAYKKAVADLQREKALAVNDADIDRVTAIDEELDRIKAEAKPVAKNETNPILVEWIAKPENKWFNDDKEMNLFAVASHDAICAANPNIDLEESLKMLTKQVKRAFPEKFTNPARSSAATVETAVSASGGGKKVFTYRDLSEEQRRIADNFERKGIMKKDDYVKQMAESGLIGE